MNIFHRQLLFTCAFMICALPAAYGQVKNTKRLEIEGTVVARERLFGHIYDDREVNPRLLVVRVDKVIKGKINNPHILVNYQWRLYDKGTPLEDQFASKWNFRLTEKKFCDSVLRDIQMVEWGPKGTITGILPRFERAWALPSVFIDLGERLPCYELKRGNFALQADGRNPGIVMPTRDKDFFVLDEDLWTNAPDSPLEIRLQANSTPFLQNVSGREIDGYTLGCVRKISDGFATSKFFPVTKDHFPVGSATRSSWSDGTNDFMEQFKICRDLKSMVSVSRVLFSNGDTWEIK
jgi:hypothetical protein